MQFEPDEVVKVKRIALIKEICNSFVSSLRYVATNIVAFVI